MPYWELVTRSFKIAWRYKYLWLLALFAGEAGGASYNYSQSTSQQDRPLRQPADLRAFYQPFLDWLNSHAGLLVATAVLVVALWIAFFVLAAVCEGAVVRAAAEHDAERPFGLGIAWRCGRATMGTILRLRLLLIALALPVGVASIALILGLILTWTSKNAGFLILLLLLVLFVLASIPYILYLHLLDRLGTRAVVLEQLTAARAALGYGHRLLRKRLGRVLLVWLVTIAIGFVAGIALLIPTALVILPVVLIGIATYSVGGPTFWLLGAFALLILVPVFLAIAAFLAAQVSTFWTLAYRRLEIDQVPAYAYPYPRPQPVAPPATPSA